MKNFIAIIALIKKSFKTELNNKNLLNNNKIFKNKFLMNLINNLEITKSKNIK
jgi:hypothetical protein